MTSIIKHSNIRCWNINMMNEITTHNFILDASGTTRMDNMYLDGVPLGTYLLFFGTSVSHNSGSGKVHIVASVNEVILNETHRTFSRPVILGGSTLRMLNIVGVPINIIDPVSTISIHWYTESGIAKAYNRSLTLIRLN